MLCAVLAAPSHACRPRPACRATIAIATPITVLAENAAVAVVTAVTADSTFTAITIVSAITATTVLTAVTVVAGLAHCRDRDDGDGHYPCFDYVLTAVPFFQQINNFDITCFNGGHQSTMHIVINL